MIGNLLHSREEIVENFPAGAYVFSRVGLQQMGKLIKEALKKQFRGDPFFSERKKCQDWPLHDDDLYLSMCADEAGIKKVEAIDELGRQYLCPFNIVRCYHVFEWMPDKWYLDR
eukprot:UN09494